MRYDRRNSVDMDPRMLRVYTERFEKEKKFIRLQEKFVAIGRNQPLTGKFYAKHDAIPSSEVPQEYVDLITKRLISVPTDIYEFRPPNVNAEYGWFSKPLIPLTDDPRLRFPRTRTDFIVDEIRIRHGLRGLPIEKFTGIPFKA